MTITITNKEFLYLDPIAGNYAAFEDGNDINSSYYHITLSNNLDFYIPGWWNTDIVKTEIDASVVAAQAREDASVAAAAAAQSLLDSL